MIVGSYNYNNPKYNQNFQGKRFIHPFSFFTNKFLKGFSDDAVKRNVSVIPDLAKNITEVSIPVTRKTKISAWDINPSNSEKYVLFLHGMAMNISNYQYMFHKLMGKIGIFAPEYRGYGKTANIRSTEQTLYKDANKAYKYLTKKKGIKPENIIIVAHSMGTAMATDIAKAEKKIKSLILISPLATLNSITEKFINLRHFRSGMPDFLGKLIKKNRLIRLLHGTQFNSLGKAKAIKDSDVYIIHSRADVITKASGGKKLADIFAKNGNLKEFRLLETGNHRVDKEKSDIVCDIIYKVNGLK